MAGNAKAVVGKNAGKPWLEETLQNTAAREDKIIFNIEKEKNFSEWFSEIIKTAELADLRYNVKGFLVFQPWSVLCMEEMYKAFEKEMQAKGHKPYFFPAVIPEKNFFKEKEHVEGFAPEVFWVTETGAGNKLEEKLALRPTSETAFYQMFALWIRSYNDLPFKTYQRAQVWRFETKATRPFLRGREFHWIEGHCAFAGKEGAERQVLEDMDTVEKVMHLQFGVPFIFFKRPSWDKFAGADSTFGADSIMPDGKLIQQPSTHLLGQNFSKPFNVKFVDKDGKEKFAFLTCFGPAISRIFASVIAVHGDNKGLKFPFNIAPLQVVIVPIAAEKNKQVVEKCCALWKELNAAGLRVEVDLSEKTVGEKFYYWEMKGVPLRLELGPKELKAKEVLLYRRDLEKKKTVKLSSLAKAIGKESKELSKNLLEQADAYFKNIIKEPKDLKELREMLEAGKVIAKCSFCSAESAGVKCAEIIEKEFGARVRGTKVDRKETPTGNCIVCGKTAKEVVYIGREY